MSVVCAGMHEGGRVALKVRPSYGFHHPTCKMPPPPGVNTRQVLGIDMELVRWLPAKSVSTDTQYSMARLDATEDILHNASPRHAMLCHVFPQLGYHESTYL
jgi:hypothetical protein